MHLPRNQPSDVKPCDEQIGRFCYWHSPDDSVMGEPRDIIAARVKMLRMLDTLSERLRGDEWIAGQRVRYWVEAGNDSAALVASRECWAAVWWCEVLRGFAFHATQRYAESETVFDSALVAMPTAERCRWTDLALLLNDDDREHYTALACDSPERIVFEHRFWQLADPSYLVPGNDRRTEHFSRVLLATLSATAQNAYGLPWGDDLHDLLIRYGAPLTYSTTWATWPATDAPQIGHEREPSYHFAALDAASSEARWDVRADRARERYAPMYMDSLFDLDAQFGMFRRGDSALVVAIYAGAETEHHAHANETIGITDPNTQHVLTPHPHTNHDVTTSAESTSAQPPAQETSSDTQSVTHASPSTRVRITRAPWKGVVVGVEQYDTLTRWARRARRWLAPPDVAAGAPALSTLLFYNGDDTSVVTSLHDALSRAIITDDIPTSRKIGVYWESYDTTSHTDSSNAVTITVTRTDGGFFRRLAQTFHLSAHDSPLVITWHDVPTSNGLTYRSLVLDLHQLPPGTYHIALATGPDATHQTVATRDLRLH